MPNDIAVISKISRGELTQNQLRGVGYTDFIFQPYENDIQFDRLRKIRTFTGVEKLVQSMMRAILTTVGDSFEDPEWGSKLNSSIGTKVNNDAYAAIRESIIAALTHYNSLNQDNPESDEVIETIDELQVVNDSDDPRIIRVIVGVTTEAGTGVRVIVPQVEL